MTTVADSVPTPVSEAEIKQVADKLKAAERRNAEYRNQVQGLRDELKMAHKVSVMSLRKKMKLFAAEPV